MSKIWIPTLRCRRCGWEWFPRKEDVTMCPACKSRLWNVPKEAGNGSEGSSQDMQAETLRA